MTHRLSRETARETQTEVDRSPQRPILTVTGLGRCVQNYWVWRDLSFEVWGGDRLAVVGPSGSGKSLLLRALAGLDAVQEGQIVFDEKPLVDWFMPSYRCQIIYLHQRPALIEGTVEENLQQVYKLASHRDQGFDRQRILEYLHLIGRTGDFLDRPIAALSGGEAQIAAFLRALQLSPGMLLLDEPTASLDPETAYRLEDLVQAWQAEDPQRAYLWTSHNPTQLERITDRHLSLGPA